MLEKLYISFILELMSDWFEVCDPQDDGIGAYDMLYPSASCQKFMLESGLGEGEESSDEDPVDPFKYDLDGNGKITYREMQKAMMEPFGWFNSLTC